MVLRWDILFRRLWAKPCIKNTHQRSLKSADSQTRSLSEYKSGNTPQHNSACKWIVNQSEPFSYGQIQLCQWPHEAWANHLIGLADLSQRIISSQQSDFRLTFSSKAIVGREGNWIVVDIYCCPLRVRATHLLPSDVDTYAFPEDQLHVGWVAQLHHCADREVNSLVSRCHATQLRALVDSRVPGCLHLDLHNIQTNGKWTDCL